MTTGNKKKILIVVPALACGGLERNVALICNHIDTTRFEVTLAVLNNERPFFRITNPAVTVLDLEIRNVRNSLFRILKLCRDIRPDILFTTANHLNLLIAMFRWMFPAKLRIVARESSIMSINTKHAKFPWLYNRLLKRYYKHLDIVVCQSKFMQEDMVRLYGVSISKTRIIYNAVEPVKVQENLPEKNPVFITVARLSKEKGIDRLIKAVGLLPFPFKFYIIGAGEMHAELKALIIEQKQQEKIILQGSSTEPFSIVRADLFLLGSHYEGFPNALLEATAAGIPAVAFNAPGGIPEVLTNNKNGILVEGNSIEDFSAAIEIAWKKGFDRKEVSDYTLSRFDLDTIIKQWEELFASA